MLLKSILLLNDFLKYAQLKRPISLLPQSLLEICGSLN